MARNEPKQAASAADPTGDGGAGLVFWLLIGLGLAGLAPCLVLPAWRSYQHAELGERIKARQVNIAQADVTRRRSQLEHLRSDPGVVTRLAQRELEYRIPGASAIEMDLPDPNDNRRHAVALAPVNPPIPVARLVALLPDLDYDALFCRKPTSTWIAVMSAVVFMAAFVVFWPRSGRCAAESSPLDSVLSDR